MEAERSFHPIPDDNGNFGFERSLRDLPPAHYTLKIESFSALSKLLQDCKVEHYDSDVFESGGFKWRLSLYPSGNKGGGNGEGHVSVYLVITDTDKMPLGWEVYAKIKLYVYDQIQDKYMTVQDSGDKVRRFHKMKTEWGFDRFLPLSSFKDAAYGYLVHDTCVFGAEVFVLNYSGKGESVDVLETETYTWKVEKFSTLAVSPHYSDVFTIGNRKWKLRLYPKGELNEGKWLSLFIELEDTNSFPSERKTYAKYVLRVKNQLHGNHAEHEGNKCFDTSCAWGWASFMSLTRLRDTSAGFLVDDKIIIEAQVKCLSTVENFSKQTP